MKIKGHAEAGASAKTTDLAVAGKEPVATGLLLGMSLPRVDLLEPLKEVNGRCIDLLVHTARSSRPDALPLVGQILEELRGVTPEVRTRIADRAILLVDMQFKNGEWWRKAKQHPSRPAPLPAWRGAFPRPGGSHLARITLTLAWHTIVSDRYAACLMGMTREVAGIVAEFSPIEILRIAELHHRHIRPRWEDRPGIWRRLFQVARSDNLRKARDFNLYTVHLLTGEVLTPSVDRGP